MTIETHPIGGRLKRLEDALSLAEQALTFYKTEGPLDCQTPLTERALRTARTILREDDELYDALAEDDDLLDENRATLRKDEDERA